MNSHYRKCIAIFAGCLLWLSSTQAQQATTAAGGDALSTGGSVAYSVGQIDYITIIGNDGSVAQGVQQPYEFYIVAGVENDLVHLVVDAYPNPISDFLQLHIEYDNWQDVIFQLVDIEGSIIESRKITSATETIDMSLLSSDIYFLKVSCQGKELKTFKVIKN